MTLGRSYRLGTIRGIEIDLHISWFVIFILLAYGLAVGLFPEQYPGHSNPAYIIMGTASAILLFLSVLIHEMAHSLVAKGEGIEVHSVTLFFFGGVASISDENITPMNELKMSLAGPLTSIVLGALSLLMFLLIPFELVQGVLKYLYTINFILGVFNMVPGYPLDGGRVLRALIWLKTKDLRKATWYASYGGRLFGYLLVVMGFIGIFSHGGGLWYVLIGMFIVFLARVGYEQVVVKQILSGVNLKALVKKSYPTIEQDKTVLAFVQMCKQLGVSSIMVRGRTPRVVSLQQIGRLPSQFWDQIKLSEAAKPAPAMRVGEGAYHAFVLMQQNSLSFLPVMDDKGVIGVVSSNELFNILRIGMMEDQNRTLGKAVKHVVRRIPVKGKAVVASDVVPEIKSGDGSSGKEARGTRAARKKSDSRRMSQKRRILSG